MSRKNKYFFVLTGLIFIILSSYLVSATAECNPVNGDQTHMGCVETKDKLYNTTTPIINVSFNEYVDVNDDFVLYKIGELGEKYPDPFNPIFLDNLEELKNENQNYSLRRINSNSYSYQPTVHIPNGIYLFKLSAFNAPNVFIDVAVLFSINGTSMKFWVSSPTNDLVGPEDRPLFAFSNNSIFDLQLTTERPVDGCRFSKADIPGNKPYPLAYVEDTVENFETVDETHVTYYDFNIAEFYPYPSYNGAPRKMSIICKESGSERYAFNIINVGVDQSIPSISVSSDFSPIVDSVQRRTNITIRTDDASACTINKIYIPNYDTSQKISQMNNLPLILRDSSYNFTKYSEFVPNYAELLIFSANPTPHNYTYNITCTNLANLKNSALYVVNVQFVNIQSFEFYSPQSGGYINSRSILVNGSASIGSPDVTCNASLNTSGPFTALTRRNEIINGRYTYSNTLNVPADGTYTVYVTCKYMYDTFASQTFNVDTVPPTVPNVTASENSCSLEDIEIVATSRDTGSGIRRYYYNLTVDAAEKEFISGTSSSGRITIDIDELEENKTYPVTIFAEDNAGLRGPSVTKQIKITSPSIPACDKVSPTIKINTNQNNITKIWNVTVNCTDSGSGCRTQFIYGIEPNSNNTCKTNRTANLLLPIAVTTSATFCATVFDNNNNNASDSKNLVIAYPSGCTNSIKDGNETDLNCGGSCPKCAINKSCIKSSDCISNYCLNGKCAGASCTDKIKNGDEAGVDCGGSCTQKCGINSTNVTCTSDNDCITFNCLLGKCEAASCTDKKLDGNETDIDCGGSCPTKCANGKGCFANSDCSSKYCNLTIKRCVIDPTLDTDKDGLPDAWEYDNCGSITGCNPKEDLDKDKYDNKEEFESKTNPNDSESYPEGGRKISTIALIFLILGALMIIGGGTFKVLIFMDEEKKHKSSEEKEMLGTLNQIPKINSVDKPLERELTEEEKLRGQQARLKALRERSTERKKMINQFDSEDKPAGQLSNKNVASAEKEKESGSSKGKSEFAESEQRQIPLKKSKYLDEGIKDEYVDISDLKSKKLHPEDPFSKLKTIAGKRVESKAEVKTETEQNNIEDKTKINQEKSSQEISKKQNSKESNEDVFEKLKTISKSKKK